MPTGVYVRTKPVWNKGKTRQTDSRIPQPWLGKKRPEISGVKNWSWKGGEATQKERNKIYDSKRDRVRRRYLHKIWSRKKKQENPKYRLDCNFSSAVSMCLKGEKKWRRWQVLVGYSFQDLVKHLEKQFSSNMSWDNYGSYWHVDHIKPKVLFIYRTAEDIEFKECWALSNLRPLEAQENLKKNRFYEPVVYAKQVASDIGVPPETKLKDLL